MAESVAREVQHERLVGTEECGYRIGERDDGWYWTWLNLPEGGILRITGYPSQALAVADAASHAEKSGQPEALVQQMLSLRRRLESVGEALKALPVPSRIEVTEEHIEALSRANHAYAWEGAPWDEESPEHQEEYRVQWRALVQAPAFQALLRSVAGDAWREGRAALVKDMAERLTPGQSPYEEEPRG